MIERYYRSFTLSRQAAGANVMTEPSYSEVGTYRGFIQPRSGSESTAFNAVDEGYTPVQYGDRVEQDGVTWRVVFATQPTGISAVAHHKEIRLQYVGDQ
jgi:hypothetical protein